MCSEHIFIQEALKKSKKEVDNKRKEMEKQQKELEHKRKKQQKELERKSKEIEQKHRNFLEDKRTYITPKKSERMLGELECCICQDLMAMTHSLRCGHTFCGPCILQVRLLILHPSFAMQLLVNFLVSSDDCNYAESRRHEPSSGSNEACAPAQSAVLQYPSMKSPTESMLATK
jgi:hypothetical protein